MWDSEIVLTGSGEVATIPPARWEAGNATIAGIVMADWGADPNSISVASGATAASGALFLYWETNTFTLHSQYISVEKGLAIAGGGTMTSIVTGGQTSNSDVALATSSFVMDNAGSPLTTKGDVFTYSTTDARLAVGTNGKVLTAASGETTGLSWATPTTGTVTGGGTNNYIAHWTGTTSVTGTSDLQWDGSTLDVAGNIEATGSASHFGKVDGGNAFIQIMGSGSGYTSAGLKLQTYKGGNRPSGIYMYSHVSTNAFYAGRIYSNEDCWGITFKDSLTNTGSSLESTADQANELFVIESGGNVGIGTGSPGAMLEIVSTADNTTAGIRLGDGSNYTAMYNSGDNFIIDPQNDFIVTGADDIKMACGDEFEFYADDYVFISGSTTIMGLHAGAAEITGTLKLTSDLNLSTDDSSIQSVGTPLVSFNTTYGMVSPDDFGLKHSLHDGNIWAPGAPGTPAQWAISGYSKMQLINTIGSLETEFDILLPNAVSGLEMLIIYGRGNVNGIYTLKPALGEYLYSGGSSISTITLNKDVFETIHVICPEDTYWQVVTHT